MNSEEILCEAEDLVRGSGKARGSATKREPLNRYRRYGTGDEDQRCNTDGCVISLYKCFFGKTKYMLYLLLMIYAFIVA